MNYHENYFRQQKAYRDNYEANVAFVASHFPNACVFADYNWESAWSEVRADRDADGDPCGEMLGSGATHEEAYANAAESVREEYGEVSEYRGECESPTGQIVHSVL